MYIYANVTRSSLFSWVDAITDGKFASHSTEEGRILYYNLLYIPYYYISERGFSGEGFPGFGRAHAPYHSCGAGKTRTLAHTQTQTHTHTRYTYIHTYILTYTHVHIRTTAGAYKVPFRTGSACGSPEDARAGRYRWWRPAMDPVHRAEYIHIIYYIEVVRCYFYPNNNIM